jgi:hypothetical protein
VYDQKDATSKEGKGEGNSKEATPTTTTHPHSTIAALEDAISVLWGIIRVFKDALN